MENPVSRSLDLADQVRGCSACDGLPLGPRPILQWSSSAQILVAGQAPGRITHHKGIPFDDPSGERLRSWLGVTRDQFYDQDIFAILPMAFCFPGSGKSGDLPPPAQCAELWRDELLAGLTNLKLTIIIGRYAADWHLEHNSSTLSVSVRRWRETLPARILLPHPSPRNNRWLKQHPWFEAELLPDLRRQVKAITDSSKRIG